MLGFPRQRAGWLGSPPASARKDDRPESLPDGAVKPHVNLVPHAAKLAGQQKADGSEQVFKHAAGNARDLTRTWPVESNSDAAGRGKAAR